jgi:cytochrome c biogenesis factor
VHPAFAFLGVLLVFLVAVWWGGTPGALLLLLLALGVAALLAATWQRLKPPDRAIRVFALLVLVAIALQEWM